MAPRKGKEKKEEQVISLGPQVAEGENVFGVCHIFASFNDTFVHVTDLSGKYVTQECGIESVCFIKSTNTSKTIEVRFLLAHSEECFENC